MYYLNNTGSRRKTPGEKLMFDDGRAVKPRAIDFWQQCGNFAFPCIRVKGKRVAVYPNSEVKIKGEEIIWRTFEHKNAIRDIEFYKRFPSYASNDAPAIKEYFIKYPNLEALFPSL